MADLLRDRDFRLLFAGQTLSMFGDIAMLLVLAMWAKDLTGSNGVAGRVFGAVVPSLLAPFAGVVIDRFRRRTVMVVVDLATAAVVVLLLLVDGREDLWLLYVVAFLYGASLVAFQRPVGAAPHDGGRRAARAGQRRARHRPGGAPAGRAAHRRGAVRRVRRAGRRDRRRGHLPRLGAALVALRVRSRRRSPRRPPPSRPGPGAGTCSAPRAARTVVACVLCTLSIGFSESVIFAVVDEGLGRPVEFMGVLGMIQGVGAILGGVAVTGTDPPDRRAAPDLAGLALTSVGSAL